MNLVSSLVLLYAASTATAARKTHTAFTRPIPLPQGGVSNDFHILPIPDGPIAVYRFAAEIVEILANGTVVPTPNYDAYLHHHVVGSRHSSYKSKQSTWTPMKNAERMYAGVGFGAGTESRGTPQEFQYPYAFVTSKGENEWIANVHIINTRRLEPDLAHRCLECPCTSSDLMGNGTVNGYELGLVCNAQLLHEKNSACFADTYSGGLRCCNDKELCLEPTELNATDTVSTYYMQYTFEYDDVVTGDHRPLYLAACCDASGDLAYHGAVEYDIPVCIPDENPGCTRTLSTRQHLGRAGGAFGFGEDYDMTDDADVEVVYVVGHQHRGGLGIQLFDDATDELLCNSFPTYGSGHVAGNESGYVIAMATCTFAPPRRMRSSAIVRVVSTYNSTVGHTGVMSLLYIALADYNATAAVTLGGSTSVDGTSNWGVGLVGVAVAIAVVVAVAIAGVAVVVYKRRAATRAGYDKVTEATPVTN
ncbi:hypothetical protein DYB38_012445 [Aphanomyces astaci]|uniref:Uncharacterized protein n=1 Tax=Aphanomyces astaci TaxID=112090 RepID=A0A397C030_APHAT|nr:hypothetical protein DYB38_012445 [Aphanomyces astaci]